MPAPTVDHPHRVAFLGVHNHRAHEAVRWWSAAYGQGERAAAEAAAPQRHTDVFGVARADLAAEDRLRSLQWLALRPGSDARVASVPDVEAVVCSGQGPNDVQVVKDCLEAGKSVFVESLERFAPADLAALAAAAQEGGAGAEGKRPVLMGGLYLRFDSALQEVSQLGMESMVGRPVLYQAHASTLAPSMVNAESHPTSYGIAFASQYRLQPVTPSLFELGIQQVDALRMLLGAEPAEVYAAGTVAAAAAGTPTATSAAASKAEAAGEAERSQTDAGDFSGYESVVLTIKTSTGALAAISLDATGTAATQRVQVVGDTSRAELAGKASASDLQIAGISHFMDVVTAGAQPRMAADDCLRAAAVMAAARESLRTGAPVPVSLDCLSAPATAAASGGGKAAAAAVAAVGDVLGGAATSVVEGTRQLLQGSKRRGAAGREGKEEEEEERVSTPPHQRATAPKAALTTPESPSLLPSVPRGD